MIILSYSTVNTKALDGKIRGENKKGNMLKEEEGKRREEEEGK